MRGLQAPARVLPAILVTATITASAAYGLRERRLMARQAAAGRAMAAAPAEAYRESLRDAAGPLAGPAASADSIRLLSSANPAGSVDESLAPPAPAPPPEPEPVPAPEGEAVTGAGAASAPPARASRPAPVPTASRLPADAGMATGIGQDFAWGFHAPTPPAGRKPSAPRGRSGSGRRG